MKKNLVEHIIDEEYVEASDIFAGTLSSILEQKLYEMKRSIELTEVVKPTGKKDKDGNPTFTGYNTKADWAKYRKQNPQMSVHGTPDNPKARAPAEKKEKTSTGTITKYGLAQRRKRGYLQAHPALKGLEFIEKVAKYKETGKLEESKNYVPGTNPIVDKARELASRARGSSTETSGETPLQRADRIRSSKEAETKSGQSKPSKVDLWYAKQKKQKGGKSGEYNVKSAGERLRSHLSKSWDTLKTGTRTDPDTGKVKKVSRLGVLKRAGRLIGTVPGVQKARNIAGSVMQSPWEVTHSESVVNEVLTSKTPVSSVIRDFVHSKNKKFKGDSKKKRIKRALGAYYSMHEAKAWKDLSQEAKKHPFGKSKNNPLTKRRRKRRLVKKIFNEE